jgi:hypothetical protein
MTRLLPRAALAAVLATGAAQAAPPADTILFVSARDHLVAYDAATGAEKARFATPGVSSDMLITSEGLLVLNHRDANQVVMVDARSLREVGRIASSGIGGSRPVHLYLAPDRPDGRRLVLVANDGNPQLPTRDDNSALILDVTDPAAPKVAGEVRLGIGHHKLAFSRDGMRFSASNISDCDEVVGVYDIADPAKPARLFAVRGADLGLNGQDGRPACDPTGRQGRRPAPHGAASFGASGLHVHNANATGQFILIQAEATPPRLAAVLTARRTRRVPAGRRRRPAASARSANSPCSTGLRSASPPRCRSSTTPTAPPCRSAPLAPARPMPSSHPTGGPSPSRSAR